MVTTGVVIVLNGVPRSGKSTLAAALVAALPGDWVRLGVDSTTAATPEHLSPGIGLRPGGERPDLEPSIRSGYAQLVDAVASHAIEGRNVVVDVGVHDDYSGDLGVLHLMAARLVSFGYLVGVRCDVDEIMRRREASGDGYVGRLPDGTVPEIVLRWERAVHDPGIYDVEVDTSSATVGSCVAAIAARVATPPTALRRILRR